MMLCYFLNVRGDAALLSGVSRGRGFGGPLLKPPVCGSRDPQRCLSIRLVLWAQHVPNTDPVWVYRKICVIFESETHLHR